MSASRAEWWHLVAGLVLLAGLGSALPCNCNNGVVLKAAPQCVCSCSSGFVLPNCDYMLTDQVRLDIYLNYSSDQFASDAFLTALAKGVTVDKSSINFLEAIGINKFGVTEVLLIMPGYGVQRLLQQVWDQVSWVQALSMESAYVIPIPPAPSSQTTTHTLFDAQGYAITVESTMYLICALLVVFVLVVIEKFCWYQNTDEVIGKTGYKKQMAAQGWHDGGANGGGSPKGSPRGGNPSHFDPAEEQHRCNPEPAV